ncbi:uncharacterized protein [Diabrotica undecimpunctata]|uniref:uncharacterized protein n=1 Tax=Diabrotica undecimpunctata TaxID=50387 RepID=UPI003B635AAD
MFPIFYNDHIIYSIDEFQDLCRTCLKNRGIINLFTVKHQDVLLKDMFPIFSLPKLELEDRFPQKICHNCLRLLIEIYSFRQVSFFSESLMTKVFDQEAVDTESKMCVLSDTENDEVKANTSQNMTCLSPEPMTSTLKYTEVTAGTSRNMPNTSSEPRPSTSNYTRVAPGTPNNISYLSPESTRSTSKDTEVTAGTSKEMLSMFPEPMPSTSVNSRVSACNMEDNDNDGMVNNNVNYVYVSPEEFQSLLMASGQYNVNNNMEYVSVNAQLFTPEQYVAYNQHENDQVANKNVTFEQQQAETITLEYESESDIENTPLVINNNNELVKTEQQNEISNIQSVTESSKIQCSKRVLKGKRIIRVAKPKRNSDYKSGF